MNVLIEYKGTTRSKFTFTKGKVRVKISYHDVVNEKDLVLMAKHIYALLDKSNWSGITLRSRTRRLLGKVKLRDSYGNALVVYENDKLSWSELNGV